MESFKMADVAQIHRRYGSGSVAWADFEPLYNQLRQILNCTSGEALQYIGYAGASHTVQWRKKDEVPILAMNAAHWVLHELGHKQEVKIVEQFSLNELGSLFALMANIPIPEDRRRALIAKLAKELAK